MKQDTKRLTSVFAAALLLAGAFMVYFSLIIPAYGNLETLKGQGESESTLYANENQIVSKANDLLSSFQNNSSSVAEVSLALPVGPNIADALAQIYGIASSAGFTPQSVSVATQAVTPAQQQSSAAAGGGQVANAASTGAVVMPTGSVTFQLSGTGTYESFKNFLRGLETNIRIFDVTGVSIQPLSAGAPVPTGKGAPSAASADSFNFTITAVTYYQAS